MTGKIPNTVKESLLLDGAPANLQFEWIAELFGDLTELPQDMTEDRGVAGNLLWGTKEGIWGTEVVKV